jgi:hypothetical protein
MSHTADEYRAAASRLEAFKEFEQRSSIKTSLNAKREAQFEAKVVDGTSDEAMAELRRIAVSNHRELCRELGIVAA